MASGMPGPHALRQEETTTALPASAAALPAKRHLSGSLGATGVAVLALLIALGWHARSGAWFSSGSGFGYALGIIGGSMMLVLLLYPLRKRLRFMHSWGPLKYWFKFHMLAGVLGPLLVLFHSTFRVGSLNAGVALSSMFLVVASGLVGRFFYRKIHHGLYGSQATLKELQQMLQQQVDSLEPMLSYLPAVKQEVDTFIALASFEPEAWYLRGAHFMTAGWKRIQAQQRVRDAISAYINDDSGHSIASQTNLAGLLSTIDTTFRAVQRNIQFSSYERLFSLWHVVHIPFLCMLVITAVVHVVAVHIY
jgi:hypothetical protein